MLSLSSGLFKPRQGEEWHGQTMFSAKLIWHLDLSGNGHASPTSRSTTLQERGVFCQGGLALQQQEHSRRIDASFEAEYSV